MKTNLNESNNPNLITRRKFLKQTAIGAAGISLAGELIPGAVSSSFAAETGGISKVVLVRHKQVIDNSGKIQQPILQEMLNKALTTFSDKSTISDAWRKYILPEDLVGLKVNTLGIRKIAGSELVSHFGSLTTEITLGLQKAGIPDKNIVIWDRTDEELANAGFLIQKEATTTRVLGTNANRREPGIGYSKTSFPVGEKSSHISRILTEMCTALVNIPQLKTHRLAGMTGAMKNHYGTIDNPRDFHDNGCASPGIPEINTIPGIRKKQRLIIADALLGVYDGGPGWGRRFIWPYGGILVGTDPVAIDYMLMKILDEKRILEDMDPVESQVKQLVLAEKLGLGTCNPNRIDLVKIEL